MMYSSDITKLQIVQNQLEKSLKEGEELRETMQRKFDATEASLKSTIEDRNGTISEQRVTISANVEEITKKTAEMDEALSKLDDTDRRYRSLQRTAGDLQVAKNKLGAQLNTCVTTKETKVERLTREKRELQASLQEAHQALRDMKNAQLAMSEEVQD